MCPKAATWERASRVCFGLITKAMLERNTVIAAETHNPRNRFLNFALGQRQRSNMACVQIFPIPRVQRAAFVFLTTELRNYELGIVPYSSVDPKRRILNVELLQLMNQVRQILAQLCSICSPIGAL